MGLLKKEEIFTMKKRALSLMLVAATAISLSACGGGSKPASSAKTSSAAKSTTSAASASKVSSAAQTTGTVENAKKPLYSLYRHD